MLVFMDESGDTGSKIGKGSSLVFVVTLIIFHDDEEATAVDMSITNLKKTLGFSDCHEFHFVHTHPNDRRKFFEIVAQHNFTYHGIVIQKDLLQEEMLKSKATFYHYVCDMVFQNAQPYLHRARVTIDEMGNMDFNKTLSAYLKRRMNQERQCISKLVAKDSKRNNLIQLADMICGALKRCYNPSRKDTSYRQMIAHLEMSLQVWPRKK